MKIYFAGSIRGGRRHVKTYAKTIKFLERFGIVLTKHVGDHKITHFGKIGADKYIFSRDVKWLEACDTLVADVTQHSLGVGYEIATAEALKKKIICLCRESRKNRLSAMIRGNRKLKILYYRNQRDLEMKLLHHIGGMQK